MLEEWVMWFEEFGMENVAAVGSKNANLGQMLRRGIPVPLGFAVTTAMYDEFMARSGAEQEIEKYLCRFPQGPKSLTDCREISHFVEDVILTKRLPEQMQDTLESAYNELSQECHTPNVPVAVRSSSVVEDLPTASFAGQYESYLNVRGKDALFDKVMRCWASLFTARSILYRMTNRLPVSGTSMSVGIQRMVAASAAGVGFTVHPGSGDDTKILLEGNWGLGESVVQGIVIPDRFIINKKTSILEKKEISQKIKQVVFGRNGTEEQYVPEDKQRLPCLNDEEVLKIADFAKTAESVFGVPLDIEWALDQAFPFPQNIFLLQARPITKVRKKKDAIDKILDMMLDGGGIN